MIIKKIEYHSVHSHMTYDLSDEDIVAEFGSIEAFEKHYEEESDEFYEFVTNHDYNREDDWFSDRKGGYDVEWSIEE